jgi:hypothetical protein
MLTTAGCRATVEIINPGRFAADSEEILRVGLAATS